MLRTSHLFRIRKTAAVALLFQLAAIFGLSVVEASHNHDDRHAVQWHGDTDDHPGDGQSAHVQCVLCGHAGTCMSVPNRAGVIPGSAIHGIRANPQASSRLVAVDPGFSTQSRAPPGHLI